MATANGILIQDLAMGGVDFRYIDSMQRTLADLPGAGIALQSRFVWGGTPQQKITAPQHVVVAFTQQGDPDNMKNATGQTFWTHGAGAILSTAGLGLEIWRRDDLGSDGYKNDSPNAVVWDQTNNRCAWDVAGTIPPGTLCLPSTPHANGYLTVAPTFTLRKGVGYWLRVKLYSPNNDGFTTLYADVIEETAAGLVVVQSGLVGFPTGVYMPINNQPLSATVARTPGSPDEPIITYNAFDFGF